MICDDRQDDLVAVPLADLEALIERASSRRFLTVRSAAMYTGLSEESVRRLVNTGKLKGYRPLRGRLLLDRRQIDAFILGSNRHPRNGRGYRHIKRPDTA